MDIQRMNRAIQYVEDHLEGEVDYEQAAKLAFCSSYQFQRLFCAIADIPLSEYIRRRRMTLAAMELQSSDIRVLDLAVKYGYDSADSFTRTFQRLHGVTPSQARARGISLKAYPPLSFYLTIKGDTPMNYRMEEKNAFKIIGVKRTFILNEAPLSEMWTQLRQNGTTDRLAKLGRIPARGGIDGLVGVCSNGNGDRFDYYVAVVSDAPTPEGFDDLTIPAATWAVFEFSGPLHETFAKAEKQIFTQWMPSSGYETPDGYEVERYFAGDTEAPDYRYEIWVPVVKK